MGGTRLRLVTYELGRALLIGDAVTSDGLAQAMLLVATKGVSLVQALLQTRAVDPARLDEELARSEAPVLRHIVPVPSILDRLPPGLCQRLLALPVRQDPRTRTIDVAVVDARDSHPAEEIAYWLRAPVRVVRTSIGSMVAALKRLQAPAERGVRSLQAPMGARAAVESPGGRTGTPAYGTPLVRPPEEGEDRESVPTDVGDFPAADPNLPIPLVRKSLMAVPIVEIGPPAIEVERDGEPSFELMRRKGSPLPPKVGPVASRGPFAPSPGGRQPASRDAESARVGSGIHAPSPPFADVEPILAGIRTASDRDEILGFVLAGVRTVARRVALFVVKRDELVGWTCTPELGDAAALKRLHLPTSAPSVVASALKRKAAHLDRLVKGPAHDALLAVMKAPPAGEVAITAVRAEGRPMLVVLADELVDTLVAIKRLDEIARATGDALARVLRNKKKG
jgi:hypothetical protein